MIPISRRAFLRLCAQSLAGLSLSQQLLPLAKAWSAAVPVAKPPVIWLELGSCTGESVSLENAVNPDLYHLLTSLLDIRYHGLLAPHQGQAAWHTLEETARNAAGQFWLIVEGSVMTGSQGRYNEFWPTPTQSITGLALVRQLAPLARYRIAVGDCACFGGPAAARPNPGEAKGLWEVISQPVINVAGCPSHPDWMTGTFSHLAWYGPPPLDAYQRPLLFFGNTIHNLCQRRQQYEDGIFAKTPGDAGCLFKVGCKGPVTHADCPLRQWNQGTNWPVRAGAPCIGCASPDFPDGTMPFFQPLTARQVPGTPWPVKKLALYVGGAAAGGIVLHGLASLRLRRIQRHWIEGTVPLPTSPPTASPSKRRTPTWLRRLKQKLRRLLSKETKE